MEPYNFDKEIVEAWIYEREHKYAIPDPSDNLIEIYEIDTLKDALHIRAEKWESPEHQTDPTMKKILNVQNPNYTELLELLRSLQKQSGNLKKNKKELRNLNPSDETNIEKIKKSNSELSQKLERTWTNLLNFINRILSLGDNELKIHKIEPLIDVRLLRFMLTKTLPTPNLEIISLIISYLRARYLSINEG